jgi:hypothetical protein
LFFTSSAVWRVPSLPENFAQYRTDILIQQQGNLGH